MPADELLLLAELWLPLGEALSLLRWPLELEELLEGKEGIELELRLGELADGMLGDDGLPALEGGDGIEGELLGLELDGIDGILLEELELVDSQALSVTPMAVTNSKRVNFLDPVRKSGRITRSWRVQ